MNGFDGAMTAFGIVLGSWIAGFSKLGILILASLGACLAMGLSGFFGAYMAEKAERERQLKEMEKSTHNHVDPIQYEASRFVEIYVALIDGLSPALTGIISIIPFIFASAGWLLIENAYMFFTSTFNDFAFSVRYIPRKSGKRKRLAIWRGNAYCRRLHSPNDLPDPTPLKRLASWQVS
jgi:predicted membrane protein (TIGR00267 family)